MPSWFVALQGFLPLIVFVIVDLVAGLRWGVVAAIVLAVAECGWEYYSDGEVDPITIGSGVLIVVLGLLAIRLNDSKFFKFQPVVLGVCLAAVFAWCQFFDIPVMVRLAPKMAKFLPEQQAAVLASPEMQILMARVSAGLILVFILHGALVAWAALRKSNVYWLFLRSVGLWVLVLGMTIIVRITA